MSSSLHWDLFLIREDVRHLTLFVANSLGNVFPQFSGQKRDGERKVEWVGR